VVNYGQVGYVNWQEVLQLEELLTAGSKPDLAVFYDGFNELQGQFVLPPHRGPSHLQSRGINDRLGLNRNEKGPSAGTKLLNAWEDASAAYGFGRTLGVLPRRREKGTLLSPWAGDQRQRAALRGANAAALYADGVGIAKELAGSYRLHTAFFWQPTLYSKRMVSGEEELVNYLGADPHAWRLATRVARSRLASPVIDLSHSLDHERAPVMYDFVHTNELGARAVARALYTKLRPMLRKLARPRAR
jgi:hypothetical protein